MCFFKNLTVNFWFVSPVEITIVFPPAKYALHNCVSLNVFVLKVRTSAVNREAFAVWIYKFLLAVFLEQGFPNFCFPCVP